MNESRDLRYAWGFLLQTDATGSVTEVLGEGISAEGSGPRTLTDYFESTSVETLQPLLAQGNSFDDKQERLLLRDTHRQSLWVWIRSDAKKTWILGLRPDPMDIEPCQPLEAFIQQILHELMVLSQAASWENRERIREQFEQIQRLNNDLVNTQRQLKQANAKLQRLNRDLNNRLIKDPLTGLISRYQYPAEIENRIALAPQEKGIFAFIDVDNLKIVNDSHGHQAGDAYLVGFATRLADLPFAGKLCMRIAGDEFGLYLHGFDKVTDETLAGIWQKIEQALQKEPVLHGSHSFPLSCSAGFAVYGQDTTHIYQLIDYADFAMYQAKRKGKSTYHRYEREAYQNATS